MSKNDNQVFARIQSIPLEDQKKVSFPKKLGSSSFRQSRGNSALAGFLDFGASTTEATPNFTAPPATKPAPSNGFNTSTAEFVPGQTTTANTPTGSVATLGINKQPSETASDGRTKKKLKLGSTSCNMPAAAPAKTSLDDQIFARIQSIPLEDQKKVSFPKKLGSSRRGRGISALAGFLDFGASTTEATPDFTAPTEKNVRPFHLPEANPVTGKERLKLGDSSFNMSTAAPAKNSLAKKLDAQENTILLPLQDPRKFPEPIPESEEEQEKVSTNQTEVIMDRKPETVGVDATMFQKLKEEEKQRSDGRDVEKLEKEENERKLDATEETVKASAATSNSFVPDGGSSSPFGFLSTGPSATTATPMVLGIDKKPSETAADGITKKKLKLGTASFNTPTTAPTKNSPIKKIDTQDSQNPQKPKEEEEKEGSKPVESEKNTKATEIAEREKKEKERLENERSENEKKEKEEKARLEQIEALEFYLRVLNEQNFVQVVTKIVGILMEMHFFSSTEASRPDSYSTMVKLIIENAWKQNSSANIYVKLCLNLAEVQVFNARTHEKESYISLFRSSLFSQLYSTIIFELGIQKWMLYEDIKFSGTMYFLTQLILEGFLPVDCINKTLGIFLKKFLFACHASQQDPSKLNYEKVLEEMIVFYEKTNKFLHEDMRMNLQNSDLQSQIGSFVEFIDKVKFSNIEYDLLVHLTPQFLNEIRIEFLCECLKIILTKLNLSTRASQLIKDFLIIHTELLYFLRYNLSY